MATNNFIPTVWSARLLANLQKMLVYGQDGVVNRDYEGEIRQYGDTVKINAIGDITLFDYVKNDDMPAPQELTDSTRLLQINRAKGFNFQIDDIDRVQQYPKLMDAAMQAAADALRDDADQYIASRYVEVAASNFIGSDASPESVTASNAYDLLVDLSVLLSDNRIPKDGRFVIVPPWFYGMLLKDQRFITADPQRVLFNGEVGQAAGFRVLESHNVPNNNGSAYKIIAGHPMSWSYAEQIDKIEAYRPERRFADAVKGLHVYGAKVLRPNGLAVLVANRGQEA